VKVNFSAQGGRLPQSTGIVNGGPRLLSNGSPDITAYAEGFVWPEDPEFYYRFGVRRNPRTLAGTTPGSDLLLVTVDGRQPGYSVGASFGKSAQVMKVLGADEAVNLDGGLHHDELGSVARHPSIRRDRRASYRRCGGLAAVEADS